MKKQFWLCSIIVLAALAAGCGSGRGLAGTTTGTQGAQTVGEDQQQAGSTNISKVEVTVQVVGHGGIEAEDVKAEVEEQLAAFDASLADTTIPAAERVALLNARAAFIARINQHGTVSVSVHDSDSSIGSGTGAGDGGMNSGNTPPPAKEPTPAELE